VIYIIIVIVAGVAVTSIMVVMSRGIMERRPLVTKEAAVPSQEEKELRQKPVTRLRNRAPLASTEEELSEPIPPWPGPLRRPAPLASQKPEPPPSPPEPSSDPAASAELPPSPGQVSDAPPAQTATQETAGLQEDDLEDTEPESSKGEGNQEDNLLNIFKAEEMEDTGLSDLAESLKDVDVHWLAKLTKEVSRLLGGQ